MSRNAVVKKQTTKRARINCLTGLATNKSKGESHIKEGLEKSIRYGHITAIEELEAVTFDKIEDVVALDKFSQ